MVFVVLTIFGYVALMTGPFTPDECEARVATMGAIVDGMADGKPLPEFMNRVPERKDIIVSCSPPVIERPVERSA